MEVKIKKIYWGDGTWRGYKEVSTLYCCDAMEEAMDDWAIGFGVKEQYGKGKNRKMNIWRCAPYYKGAWWYEHPIEYCPFCGLEIVIKEVE